MDRPPVGVPEVDEHAAVDAILLQSFDIPRAYWPVFLERVGREKFRVIRRDGAVRGGLVALPFAQAWGGRFVPSVGLGAVGVAPEARGMGVATELVAATLREARAAGFVTSSLYPATQPVYRKAGYEVAGEKREWTVALDAIGLADRSLPVTQVPTTSKAPFEASYRRMARRGDGLLDRGDVSWARVLSPRGATTYGYVLGDRAAPEGHLIFAQTEAQPFGYDLDLLDFVAHTPAALRRAWTFLADHRSLARNARWLGPTVDPRVLVLPEQAAKITGGMRWMLRILDLPAAVAQRGWPASTAGSLTVEVTDALLPENAGAWRITVAGGEGRAERLPSGQADYRLDIRALAPLYAGYVDGETAARLGWIERVDGAPADGERLRALFAGGSNPWMADHF